jgi:DNA-binding MarR family transcriptional regulator
MRVRSPTFREVMNDLRKFYGMKVTQRQIANIVRELEENEIVERSRSTERGLGRATVVTLKPNRILQCLFNGVKLDREGESAFFRQDSDFNEWYEGILSDPPPPKEPFLEIDKVLHDSVALPNLGFTAQISVNYRLPDPTSIWLVAKEKGSFEVLGGTQTILEGEGVSYLTLNMVPPGNSKVWRFDVELYCMEGDKWLRVGTYRSRRQIHTPTIRLIKPGVWVVESFTDCGRFYLVEAEARNCTCPAYQYGLRPCKHVLAVDTITKTLREKWFGEAASAMENAVEQLMLRP